MSIRAARWMACTGSLGAILCLALFTNQSIWLRGLTIPCMIVALIGSFVIFRPRLRPRRVNKQFLLDEKARAEARAEQRSRSAP